MSITEDDLRMYAARIRPYFAPELRGTAEELALSIARWAGANVKLLRPETTIAEILGWITQSVNNAQDSLDEIEAAILLEEEFSAALPDTSLSRSAAMTFKQVVEHVSARRRAA